MIGLASPPVERPPMTLRRIAVLLGVSMALMLTLSVVFIALGGKSGVNIPWLSVNISLFAVLLPTVVASFWPRANAPGALPSLRKVEPLVLAGVALVSLPLYIVFAALQVSVVKLLPFKLEAGLVEPLTAVGIGSFLWIWLAVALLPAATEEVLYRGAIQLTLVKRWGLAWGLPIAAVVFALAHLEPAGFLSRVLMGLWFGYLFWRTGSLWPGVVAHVLNNTWGVTLANWHALAGELLAVSCGVAALALLAGALCFRAARFWPWLSPREATGAGSPIVQMGWPTAPEKRD